MKKIFSQNFQFCEKVILPSQFQKTKNKLSRKFSSKKYENKRYQHKSCWEDKGSFFLTPTIYLASIYSFLKGYQFKTRNFSRWKNIIKEIFLFSHLQLDSFGRLFLWSTVAIYYLAAQFYNICIIQHQLLMFIYIYIYLIIYETVKYICFRLLLLYWAHGFDVII